MNKIVIYINLFMIYSFLGWLMEVILTLITQKKFVNRGFLIGPFCPIYGWGCLLIIIFLEKTGGDVFGVFLKSIVICSILEYFTSYFMEKIFNAHWWDYSNKKFNINGRICLETMVPFGFLATLIFYIVNPFFVGILKKANMTLLLVIAVILVIIYIVDNIISFKVVFKIKSTIKGFKVDNTEEINKKIRHLLESSILMRRIKQAFPDFHTRIKYIEEKIKTIRH